MNPTTSKPHLELLDKDRQELLKCLIPLTKGYILGGGTALALQAAHRLSFDFDFFSSKEIPSNLARKLSEVMSIATTSVDTTDELTVQDSHGIKLTFLFYPFPHLFDPLKAENGLELFSLKDIAAQKAYTIGRRGEYRDYFDLFTLFKKNIVSLPEVIKHAEQCYKTLFNPKIFLEQLVYFDDLQNMEIFPPQEIVVVASPTEVKQFFEEEVAAYLHSIGS